MIKKKCQSVLCVQMPEKTEFLLLKTKPKRGHFWQNVTGSLFQNEDFETGAIREAQEETGLELSNIESIHPLFEHRYEVNQDSVIEEVFLILCKEKWEITLSPKEHVDFQWIESQEIIEGITKYNSNFFALRNAMKVL